MSNGHFQDSPQPGRSHRRVQPPVGLPAGKARRIRKPRPDYPIAQPYAPPPPGRLIERSRTTDASSNSVRTVLVVAGIVVACMAGGWYFFRGPVAAIVRSNTPAARAQQQAEAEAAQLALNKPTEKPTEKAPPPEKPKAEHTPAPPKPEPPVKPKVETPPPPKPEPPKPEPPPPPKPEPPKAEPPKSETPPPVKPSPEPPQVAGLTFEKHVLPIIEGKCKNCHNEDKKRGGLDLTSLAAVLKGGESGPAVLPGKLDKSLMWKTVRDNEMPPTPNKLNPMERKILEEWIASGAKGMAVAQAPK